MPTYNQEGVVTTDDAVLLNGTSDYASKAVAAYRTSDTAGTVLGWVKTTEATLTGTIFSVADTATTNEAFFVQIDASGYLNVGTTVGGTTNQVRGGTAINDGNYHLVAASTNGTAWKLYVDGVLETLTVVTGSNDGSWWFDLTGADNLVLGALVNTSAQAYFDGTLDELSVFDSELNLTQIVEIYETGLSLNAPPLTRTTSQLATTTLSITPIAFSAVITGVTSFQVPTATATITVNIPSAKINKYQYIIEDLGFSLNDQNVANLLAEVSNILEVSDVVPTKLVIRLIEHIISSSLFRPGVHLLLTVEEIAVINDVAKLIPKLIVEENITLTEDLSTVFNKVAKVIEQLIANSSITSTALLAKHIVDSIILLDTFNNNIVVIKEYLELTSNLTELYKAVESLVEAIEISGIFSRKNVNIEILEDNFSLSSLLNNSSQFLSSINEDISFVIYDPESSIGYEAFVMNPENYAVSTYSNFNFNSSCMFEGSYLFANSSGVYELQGAVDNYDGSDHYITAKLKTASIDFGTSNIKQVPKLYLGIVNSSKLVLKVIVDGQETAWYEHKIDSEYLDTQMIEIGKGLKGRYFQFELQTKENTEFELDEIELFPVQFGRKIR